MSRKLVCYFSASGVKGKVAKSLAEAAEADLYVYWEKAFFNFIGFEEPKSRDTDPNIFLRFVKNLGAVKIMLGIKRFILCIAFVMIFSLVTGLAVNLVI